MVNISLAPLAEPGKPKQVIQRKKHGKRAHRPQILQMHEYYTPNLNKMQGFLVIFTIFVDYAHFYVNMIMLTVKTEFAEKYSFFIHKHICWARILNETLNIDFASLLAKRFM